MALHLYNKNLKKFPEVSSYILKAYTDRQKALFDHYSSRGDIKRVGVAYANLKALGAADAAMESAVKKLVLDDLRARKQSATLLAMENADPSFHSGIERSQILPLIGFQKIACHILLHWTRKTENGITRADMPFFAGSGFFIDSRHIVTAYHVIAPVFTEQTVSWSVEIKKDGAYHAVEKLLAYDSIDDIAVLETKESFDIPEGIVGLFGDSTSVKPGFDIFCLGDPQGYESTWTKGIVSAVSRRAPEIGSWMQVDAAVSPGASGGMVLGGDGKMYGMVIAGTSFGDINFAVPSSTLLRRLSGLCAGENMRFPWLGLLIKSDFVKTGTLVIQDVFPSSPLNTVGLKAGDAVMELNGAAVKTVPEAQDIIDGLPMGCVVKVKASSAETGHGIEYYVPLSARPEFAMYNATQDYDRLSVLYPYFGFRVDGKNINRVSIPFGGQSVVVPVYRVLEIRPESVLDRFGVKPGDQIAILSDSTSDMTRYLELMHLPKDKNEMKDMRDLTIKLKKEAYDEDILSFVSFGQGGFCSAIRSSDQPLPPSSTGSLRHFRNQ
jgi:S1-C subfamily serine protease